MVRIYLLIHENPLNAARSLHIKCFIRCCISETVWNCSIFSSYSICESFSLYCHLQHWPFPAYCHASHTSRFTGSQISLPFLIIRPQFRLRLERALSSSKMSFQLKIFDSRRITLISLKNRPPYKLDPSFPFLITFTERHSASETLFVFLDHAPSTVANRYESTEIEHATMLIRVQHTPGRISFLTANASSFSIITSSSSSWQSLITSCVLHIISSLVFVGSQLPSWHTVPFFLFSAYISCYNR